MSRGVVLWPDPTVGEVVRRIWDELETAGVPSLATHTHRLHQPHVSLVVGEELDVDAASAAVGAVPSAPIPCRVEAAAIFPGGILFLPLVPNTALVAEQQRVSDAVGPIVVGRWDHTRPGEWSPHLTCAYGVPPDSIADAVAIATAHLPIAGHLTTGGVEDGTTGENWPLGAG